MQNNDEILAEFILEAREILDLLDADFIRLETTPGDKKLIGNIFRALHTLKGSSGFFAFRRLEKISHAGESLLGKIRDEQIELDTQRINCLLETVDVLRIIIEGIETSQTEPNGSDQLLIEQLQSLSKIHSLHDKVAHSIVASVNETAAPIDVGSVSSNAKPENDPFDISAPSTQDRTYDIAAPVRVNLDTLDRLMNLTGEMVLARNRLLPFANNAKDLDFSQTVRSIDLLTLELQERMMKMRMQPISSVWSKFSRLVRDVSHECNKQVNLIQVGAETELDRALLDAIRDPLIHILRNSIDHSIETPLVRQHGGKPEVGVIKLNAFHQNGMVVIEIGDDGAGVNFAQVRQRAIEKKLLTPLVADQLNQKELIDLIFLPGFSTKESVSNLSGRGVGMDVVKNNITNIGGTIEVHSEDGIGTTVRLKIPLTLAIMPALMVACADEIYAIPQNRILELVRLERVTGQSLFEDFYGHPVHRLRESLIPIVYLKEELGLGDAQEDVGAVNLVVVQSSGIQFGLVVDQIQNIQDVVVKPLGPLLKNLPKYAGATILGSGRVALILDMDGVASESGLMARVEVNPIVQPVVAVPVVEEALSLLSFDLGVLQ